MRYLPGKPPTLYPPGTAKLVKEQGAWKIAEDNWR
jgi:hypothetical protein